MNKFVSAGCNISPVTSHWLPKLIDDVFAISRIMPESIKDKITNNGLFKDKESKEIEKAYYHIFTDVIPAGGSVPVVKIVGEHYESNMSGMDKGIEYINPAYYGYEGYLPAEETYDYLLKVYAKDIESLDEKLLKLKSTKGIAKSNTMFSLIQHKHLPGPLPD